MSSETISAKRSIDNNDPEEIVSKKPNTELIEEESEVIDETPKEFFNGVEISQLTKRQLKKYRKSIKWQELKKEKRAKERIKAKAKKTHAKLNNIDLGPSRKELKRATMANSPCKISICIDLSFDDLMIDKV